LRKPTDGSTWLSSPRTAVPGSPPRHLVAFSKAKTGKLLWDQQHADPKQNESFVAAPIAWDGRVFIGIAISDLGIRGRLIALDAKTGKELWRFYTVPEPGKGQPTGGGFWTTFSLDPGTGEVLGPAANPAPDFDVSVRPGPNVYTNSVIALNAATGHLNWYYQHTPADDHDWDLGSAPTLYRTRRGRDMIAVAGRPTSSRQRLLRMFLRADWKFLMLGISYGTQCLRPTADFNHLSLIQSLARDSHR
jgi:alcohol dehydrogenase (cytochrome c)